MNYTYDPSKLNEAGKDRMRLELGDTDMTSDNLTAALSDEEYEAIISQTSSFKRAKIKCIEAIIAKYRHQVNMSVDGLSYSFSQRLEQWERLLKKEKGSLAVPLANPSALIGDNGQNPPYFYYDMHKNPPKEPR